MLWLLGYAAYVVVAVWLMAKGFNWLKRRYKE